MGFPRGTVGGAVLVLVLATWRCWTRNGASRANRAYCQKPLRAAHNAQGPTAHRGRRGPGWKWPGEAAGSAGPAVRANPLPAPHSRLLREDPFDGNRRLVVCCQGLWLQIKRGRNLGGGVWREQKRTKIITAKPQIGWVRTGERFSR